MKSVLKWRFSCVPPLEGGFEGGGRRGDLLESTASEIACFAGLRELLSLDAQIE